MRGTTRIGDYVLERTLGDDGIESEYVAHHVLLPRRASVRVLASAHRGHAIRMMREACVLEALDHAGVPRLYECGVLPGERPWFAAEALRGETLSRALEAGPLAPAEVIALIRAIAEVLAHAHARGIVHQNVRGETIVLASGARRFRLGGWRDAALECEHTAPDVLGLGIVAYRALTGELPAARPAGPPRLVALIEAMLATDPRQRPSAATVAAEAALLADAHALDEDEDPPVVVDVVLADDLARPDDRPAPAPRVRWTPPHGYQRLPSQPPAGGVALGRITRRS